MASGLVRGAMAGAAGTTALNASTYLDMAIRGRGASTSPQDLVKKSADQIGLDIPGKGDERDNRLEALGTLSGTATGLVVGAFAGLVHRGLASKGRHLPKLVEIVLISGAAMALADVPLKAMGISDPKSWSAKSWASDILPHLVYGTVTYATLHATTHD